MQTAHNSPSGTLRPKKIKTKLKSAHLLIIVNPYLDPIHCSCDISIGGRKIYR
jgi:hypothetical protein